MKRLRPNSIKEIPERVLESPVGVDMIVVGLQNAYSENLDWLEKSFGRAVKMSEQRCEKGSRGGEGTEFEYLFPAWLGEEKHDFYNLMELDNFDAYSFFFAHDPERVIDYEEGIRNTYERRLSSIFWMDLQRVDSSRDDDFLEELKREIVSVISNATFNDPSFGGEVLGVEVVEVFDEPRNIFEGFSVELQKSQMLYYPYRGLRIELNCEYVEDCFEEC